jgi:hypothetical protein
LFKTFSDNFVRRYDSETDLNYCPSFFTFPKWFVDTLDKIEIEGHEYDVPHDYKLLLEHWYGKNWQKMEINSSLNTNNTNNINNRKLSLLINYVNINDKKQVLTPTENHAKYTFPEDQIEWMKENDPINNLI